MSTVNSSFHETQRFDQWWLRLIVIACWLLGVGINGYGIVQQLIFDKPWGNRPVSDATLVIMGIVALVFCVVITLLFLKAKLITELRGDGLYIRFVPFHLSFRKIPLQDVTKVEARTYHPIMEYGGWGIRWNPCIGGRAYNVSGNRGVRLDFSNGKHLMVGSQRPDELHRAIEQAIHNT